MLFCLAGLMVCSSSWMRRWSRLKRWRMQDDDRLRWLVVISCCNFAMILSQFWWADGAADWLVFCLLNVVLLWRFISFRVSPISQKCAQYLCGLIFVPLLLLINAKLFYLYRCQIICIVHPSVIWCHFQYSYCMHWWISLGLSCKFVVSFHVD